MQSIKIFLSTLCLLSGLSVFAQTGKPLTEKDYYLLKTVAIPEDIKLEVGGLAPMADGRLAVSTRRGQIWVNENPYMINGTQPHYQDGCSHPGNGLSSTASRLLLIIRRVSSVRDHMRA